MSDSPLKNYTLGVLFFMGIISLGLAIIGAFSAQNAGYLNNNNQDYNRMYSGFSSDINQTDEAVSMADEFNRTLDSVSGGGGVSMLDGLIGGGWNVLKDFGDNIKFMNEVFKEAGKLFGIPTFIIVLIISAITIIIVFAIIRAIFNRDI